MYKYILGAEGDINGMALFALVTFFILFVISCVALFGKSRQYIDKMSNLPIEEDFE